MLAESLKRYREQFELTQKQVADALSIDRSTYSYYETGKSSPTLDTLMRLALMFSTTTDNLLGFNSPDSFREGAPSYHKSKDSGAMAATLSSDEKNMIIKYRQLPESLKKKVQECVDECLEKTIPE